MKIMNEQEFVSKQNLYWQNEQVLLNRRTLENMVREYAQIKAYELVEKIRLNNLKAKS